MARPGRKPKAPRHKIVAGLPLDLYGLVDECSEKWGGHNGISRSDIIAHATALFFDRPELSPLKDRPEFRIEGPRDRHQDPLPYSSDMPIAS